ncbi:serine--tRNA ligase [Candidatus Wolfebacteria bacterium RIFCSPLOWO2_01_FULL_38_11]|uniref:Serine--tRNA ligase n=2 Tax=Candidatus Wolfeibacteriota TaxID=1752735 RepID=A0A0G0J518_9BACT|nr:MAG: seryl-tRNA synthetase, seryl-tRNA synthetase [Candidatus Wolfebacteria bacterium GW2011_GWC1_37_10]OGM91376.1 MAG: serine--tRNA ligase [Candidatus Wolfebacteria bacterium RIFCSPLOWO2_01_FULL_38_11]
MLDIELIRQNPEKVKKGIANKKINPKLVDDFLNLDAVWRKLTKETDDFRANQKILSENRKIEEAKSLKEKIKNNEEKIKTIEKQREEILYLLPNLPFDEVPVGKDESESQVLKVWGNIPKFDFEPKDHLELGEALGIIDTERASKVSGSRFGYLKNQAALLEFALVQFALDIITKEGFIPIIPPAMIKPEAMRAMGYVERGGEEIYFLEKDNLYLIGTSEQAVGPMHMDEVFNDVDLPRRYLAFSSCFRREAGSYGKDTKGILRLHQFDKVEMFSITTPEDSAKEHKLILSLEEKLIQGLNLPYRVLNICTGDLGDSAAAKYDIEVWLPSQKTYRETHSASNTTDFQARRLNIKYKSKDGQKQHVHMLNGTAFAIGRMLIAIMENYQQSDGSILVPKVLQKYAGFKTIS